MKCVMYLLVLGIELLSNNVASASMIPSSAEQADLLLNVQEVFEQVKLLTKDEAQSTNISVVQDIEFAVKRAEYTLDLLQQITQLRLSCTANSVSSLDVRPTIKQLAQDGKDALRNCTRYGVEDIADSSVQLANVTNAAIERGQLFLDSLETCSRKSWLSVTSCYREIIASDVGPVKTLLLTAVETRRITHFKALEIRDKTNSCVDETVDRIKNLLENTLEGGLKCNK